VLWRCWLGGRKGIRPVKTEWWGAGVVVCLELGADLHMAQLIPLPLTVSCFSKIQIGFTFLVPAYPGSPGKGPLNGCVCVCVCVCVGVFYCDVIGRLLLLLVINWSIDDLCVSTVYRSSTWRRGRPSSTDSSTTATRTSCSTYASPVLSIEYLLNNA